MLYLQNLTFTLLYSAIIPSHAFALLIQECIGAMFKWLSIRPSETLKEIAYAVAVALIALALGWVLRKLVVFISGKLLAVHKTPLTEDMINEKVMFHCSHIIPPIVMLALLPFAFNHGTTIIRIAEKLLWIYTTVVIAIAINAILTLIWTRYNRRENTRNLPLKGILNTAKGVVWAITVIGAVSVILDRSPAYLLTGLGAFAAALMLIFKDSILGLVAGIQLSQNDMLRVGDWIVVPKTDANGMVLDMSLTAVKVRNWDNTIVTLPPYTLVSTSFQNWRGMWESGCRRIDRQVFVDVYSVKALNSAQVDDIVGKLPLLSDFVARTKAGAPSISGETAGVNGTVDTNLGLFRAYICEYILHSEWFNHSAQILVRVTEPVPQGIPLDIYCFTATTKWAAYEAIQSALFEHIIAVAPIFGLNVYNTPSGTDVNEVRIGPTAAAAMPSLAAPVNTSADVAGTIRGDSEALSPQGYEGPSPAASAPPMASEPGPGASAPPMSPEPGPAD